jgi:hypothetical protein
MPQVELHKTHLLLLLANGLYRNRLCSSSILQVMLAPGHVYNM